MMNVMVMHSGHEGCHMVTVIGKDGMVELPSTIAHRSCHQVRSSYQL